MSNEFFISDTHFNHGNILKYCHRPFLNEHEQSLLESGKDPYFKVSRESIDFHDTTLINNINDVVERNDILWHLGDFAFADYKTIRQYRDRINCQNIYLIWGNHDKHEIRDLFTECHDQHLLLVGKQKIFLNHFPMLSWERSHKGSWMLHGHVHGSIRKNPLIQPFYDSMPICDVGVDGPCIVKNYNHTFKPWSMHELTKFMATKEKNNDQSHI